MELNNHYIPLIPASLDIRAKSKAVRIRSSTVSPKSDTRDCTRVGRAPRLYAVCRDEASSD